MGGELSEEEIPENICGKIIFLTEPGAERKLPFLCWRSKGHLVVAPNLLLLGQ
jgi:hypothetical protein